MCGVVAFAGGAKSGDRERFIRLCTESTIRGVHAFGIAYHAHGKLQVFKSTDFEAVISAIPEELPNQIIFHNRYSTSGDHHIVENNQPLHIEGNALAFNGTVDMGTKAEMEDRNNIVMHTDNDGELIMYDLLNGDPFARLKSDISTFAGVFLGKYRSMYAFRNNMRPLWLFCVDGNRWVSSTADIALRAGFDKNNGALIQPFKLVRIWVG